MFIPKKKRWALKESACTHETSYHSRRQVLKLLGIGGAGVLAQSANAGLLDLFGSDTQSAAASDLPNQESLKAQKTAYGKTLSATPERKATHHNNFYEFGTSKTDPAENAHTLQVKPWKLTIEGEVNQPKTIDVWDLIHSASLEERIYRMRCVEAWSMVIPWVGIPLATLLKQCDPTSKAKYVAFETLYDPKQMPGQASRYMGGGIQYPYVEGLRIDEAMNPLTLLSVGAYGKTLAPQNGAPIRLVVPWKYGFKGIKSIVKIRLTDTMPPTTWNKLAASEYGFYANVNPKVDHPRWSQATERFIGEGGAFSVTRQETLPFNGYGEEVAQLYTGMDLRKFY